MNLRTTIVLLALAVGGGATWWFWDDIAPRVGLRPRPVNPDGAGSPTVLERQLARDKIRRIEIQSGAETVVLEKGQGDSWVLPGKWPTRTAEADELITLLTTLHSRFNVIPFTQPEIDLKPYGLDPSQKPVTVTVLGAEPVRLVFGEPEEAEGGAFARPTYVRINEKPEIVRLGPDILPILRRSREYYQRRQLFPEAERVRFTESRAASQFSPPDASAGGPTAVPRARSIMLEGPQGRVVLRAADAPARPAGADLTPTLIDPLQLAERWEIVEPFKDRPEPEKLKALLSAIPNLWVESFAPSSEALLVAAGAAASATEGGAGMLSWLKLATQLGDADWMKRQTELDNPKYKLTVTLTSGDVVALHLGKLSPRTTERPGPPQPPPRPGMPPMPAPPIKEEYRYARLDGQPLIFEIKADKLNDLFVPAAALRDERLARFQSRDVNRVTIQQKGATIVLTREKDDRKVDRWRLLQPLQALADNDKVNELLDKLAGLEARDKDVLDSANLKEAGFDPPAGAEVALVLEEELPTGQGEEKKKRTRTVSFRFGKHDAMTKKVNVRVAGRERVNVVDESAVTLADRPALAYRGRRVLDFEAARVARIDVKRAAETFALQQENGAWKLAAPVAAEADKLKAGDLAADLGRLEAVEYVNDAPKPEDLAKSGLDKPELSATVLLNEPGARPQTLQVGKQRDTKPEYFARLADGTSIFVIRKDLRDRLDQGSLDYRPNQLWTLAPDKVASVKIERGADSYELKHEGFFWKLVRPFEAPVGLAQAQPIIDAITQLKAQGYQAHTAANLAEFGLDKPQVKLTFTALEAGKDGGAEKPRERTLLLGKAVPGKPEVFARLADDPAVFKVAESVMLNTDKPALDLLERHLLSLDSRQISAIERIGTAPLTARKENGTWMIQSGAASFSADQPTIAATLRVWDALQAEKIGGYGPNVRWEAFGLSAPGDMVTVTLTAPAGSKPEKHTLKLGGPAAGGGRFARLDDGPAVAVLSAALVRELTRSSLDYADKTLLSVDDAGIQSIRRQMKDNDLEITRTGGWKIVKPSELKDDEPSLDEFARQLAALRAERVAAYAPADLKPFGLDSPAALVTITVEKDGKPAPHVLKIGAPADPKAPTGERFVMVEGSKTVGVLSSAEARRLLAEPIAFRDRALVRRLPEPDKVVLERGERKATFVKAEGTWKMTEPVAAEAEHADLEEFVNALFKLRADELVADKATPQKLKEFGLDKPAATWRFFSGDKEALSLVIGKRDSTDQRVYAKLGGSDVVFLLQPAVTTRAAAEYRKRAVFTGFDAAQAETLTIAGESGKQVLRKVNGTWQLEGKPDARLRQEAVTDLLGALANLKVDHYVRDKDAPLDLYGLGKPKRVIIAQGPMGAPQELHLGNYEGGSKRAYAALPGKSEVFALSEADTAKLMAEVK